MSRGDEHDDRDAPPPRVRTTNLPIIVFVVAVAGLLLAGLLACLGFGLVWTRTADRAANKEATVAAEAEGRRQMAEAKAKAARVYPREEFRKLVVGKTEAEVRALLGPPAKESESPNRVVWYYRERTTDPATSRPDREAQIVFEGGRAVSVRY